MAIAARTLHSRHKKGTQGVEQRLTRSWAIRAAAVTRVRPTASRHVSAKDFGGHRRTE